MNRLSSGASGATQPGEAQNIWCTSVVSSVIGVMAVRPTTAWRGPGTPPQGRPRSLVGNSGFAGGPRRFVSRVLGGRGGGAHPPPGPGPPDFGCFGDSSGRRG